MIRVLLVDDHPLVRHGLTAVLDALPDIEVVGAVEDGALAADAVSSTRPDVVLMDLSMPGLDGVDATRAVLERFSETRVRAVRDAAAGHAPLSPRAAMALLPGNRSAGRPTASGLSAREREVLALVAVGLPNKSIARRLEISERTVKAHLTHIFSTLGVSDRTSAALWAHNHGMV